MRARPESLHSLTEEASVARLRRSFSEFEEEGMPHHKSAEKRLRTGEISRQRNAGVKSQVRNQIKRQRGLTGAEAAGALAATHAELDRAARKGVIPKRRAARLKSRTARKANRSA
jgi:small subunit ribosomal protein S20